MSTPESDKEELSNPHQYNYENFKTGFSEKSFNKEHEVISQKEKIEYHFALKNSIQRSSSQQLLINPLKQKKENNENSGMKVSNYIMDLGNSNNADF